MTNDSEEDRIYSPDKQTYTTKSGDRYSYDPDDDQFYRDIPISSGSSGGGFTGPTNKNEGDRWDWLIIILGILLAVTCPNILSNQRVVNDSKLESTIKEGISKPVERPVEKPHLKIKPRIIPTKKSRPLPKTNLMKMAAPYIEPKKINPDTNIIPNTNLKDEIVPYIDSNKISQDTNKVNLDITKIEVKPRVEAYQTETRTKFEPKQEVENDVNNNPVGVKMIDGSRKELESQFAGPLNITYYSGKSYGIDKEEYPEFYKKLDLNRDGKISFFELYQAKNLFNEIIKRNKEGDIKSIVKEFVRRY